MDEKFDKYYPIFASNRNQMWALTLEQKGEVIGIPRSPAWVSFGNSGPKFDFWLGPSSGLKTENGVELLGCYSVPYKSIISAKRLS